MLKFLKTDIDDNNMRSNAATSRCETGYLPGADNCVMKIKSITTDSGVVSYRICEKNSDLSLVFIHGAVGDSRLFRNQLRHFGKDYRTLAIDLPGHGRSEMKGLPSIEDFTLSINRVLQEENIGSYILLGHSMGGGICLELYGSESINPRAMVLISTAPVLPVSRDLIEILDSDDMNSLAEMLVRQVFTKKVDILTGFARKVYAEMGVSTIKNDISICQEMDYKKVLGRISVPVLLVANRGDNIVPYMNTASMMDTIPDSRLVIYDEDGHVPFFENDKTFNKTLDEFIGFIN